MRAAGYETKSKETERTAGSGPKLKKSFYSKLKVGEVRKMGQGSDRVQFR